MTGTLNAVLDAVDGGLTDSHSRLFDLLRIPSISTDPDHDGDCRRAADWLADMLSELGFEASVRPTQGKPMVLAHWPAAKADASGPSVLFYGHYDVQPPDPLDLWESPPFEPTLRVVGEGREQIVARGAADDKGQLMTFLEACRAWIGHTGSLPVPVTILLEGEEESGSKSLPDFLDSHRDALRADVALICDTMLWQDGTPAITVMLRGMVAEEVIVEAPSRDLHSGMYGGAARNPNRVLARIVADLHDDDGSIAIPGFYDGIVDPPPRLRYHWAGLQFDPEAFLGAVGLSLPAGEADRPVLQQIWSRPTCDVTGLNGGYTGAGFKTVIPSEAMAKVSFRLVPGQDPQRIRDAFRNFVRQRLPEDCTVRFTSHGLSPGMAIDTGSRFVTMAEAALRAEFGQSPALVGSGGSIPIVEAFKRTLGIDSLLLGFAREDSCMHSPNEIYDTASFRHGTRTWARLLGTLGGNGAG